MRRILLVAATEMEIAPTLAYLSEFWTSAGGKRLEKTTNTIDFHFQKNQTQIRILITGVGLTATAFALGREPQFPAYDLAIQAGIAGAIDRSLALGQLVRVATDRFADLGAEDRDGRLIDLQELGFLPEGANSPFNQDGTLSPLDADSQSKLIDLPAVHGISVNKVHGSEGSISLLREKYPQAQVESMEGAAFFYACYMMGWPALQLRTISNYVEARDKGRWEIGEAVEGLNAGVINLIKLLR
ncbi:MAG: futalosine hydrolase [Bacteroidota bacterium]